MTYSLFSIGGPELLIIAMVFLFIPLPLIIAYRIGLYRGKKEGRQEAQNHFKNHQNKFRWQK